LVSGREEKRKWKGKEEGGRTCYVMFCETGRDGVERAVDADGRASGIPVVVNVVLPVVVAVTNVQCSMNEEGLEGKQAQSWPCTFFALLPDSRIEGP
jgi:hypothetical protein